MSASYVDAGGIIIRLHVSSVGSVTVTRLSASSVGLNVTITRLSASSVDVSVTITALSAVLLMLVL